MVLILITVKGLSYATCHSNTYFMKVLRFAGRKNRDGRRGTKISKMFFPYNFFVKLFQPKCFQESKFYHLGLTVTLHLHSRFLLFSFKILSVKCSVSVDVI